MKFVMDERVKHRLVGVAVIVSIAAIFAPAMMKKSNQRFENPVSASVKLPPKPALPRVAATEEKELFKTVKIAHIDIPEAREDFKAVSTIAKAEPLTPVNVMPVNPVAAKAVAQNETIKLHVTPKLAANKVQTASAKKALALKKTLANQAKPKAIAKNAYAVQLATFSRQANAVSLINRLKTKGYRGFFTKVSTAEGQVYKVFVGQTSERQKAQLLQQQLASAMQIKGFIVETGIS